MKEVYSKKLYVTDSVSHELLEKYPWIEVVHSAPIIANTIHSIETKQEIDYMDYSTPDQQKA